MRIFDSTLSTLERALDVRLIRHNLLAGNLANADTPGFAPADIDFAAAMAQATPAGSTSAPAIPPGQIPVEGTMAAAAKPSDPSELPLVTSATTSPGIDGNAVDADRALVAIAENALQYGAVARAAGKKLALLRYVASDGTA
jgi:flagellar basal-body rod protein FlgB